MSPRPVTTPRVKPLVTNERQPGCINSNLLSLHTKVQGTTTRIIPISMKKMTTSAISTRCRQMSPRDAAGVCGMAGGTDVGGFPLDDSRPGGTMLGGSGLTHARFCSRGSGLQRRDAIGHVAIVDVGAINFHEG